MAVLEGAVNTHVLNMMTGAAVPVRGRGRLDALWAQHHLTGQGMAPGSARHLFRGDGIPDRLGKADIERVQVGACAGRVALPYIAHDRSDKRRFLPCSTAPTEWGMPSFTQQAEGAVLLGASCSISGISLPQPYYKTISKTCSPAQPRGFRMSNSSQR